MSLRRHAERPRVAALLGPTNTGKTHRAIERMLAWPSGMIGLPLRLLAREVYDKVVERIGADRVALVTGEEKRVPASPSYWVCTVEAMPVDKKVAFLAVDEVQLAGDRNRGHTFTDRLLNARGLHETVFLGASTVRPLLEQLIPGVEVEGAPRLSKLSWKGVSKLATQPPRSAIVAFSADQVYEAAERLRAVHGGTAVVLGALSPRTRNAQVEMYQAGEVQHLVATDAIGMGLNMEVHHVAFTAVRKFDGRGFRDLSPAELAQIAGRAGRYRTDGTFGTTRELGPLEPDVIEAIEHHRFPPLRVLFWRNTDLDFSSGEALLRSLQAPPPRRGLVQAFGEDDERALEALLRQGDVAARITGPRALERLWEVCRVPDYRKTHTAAHAELLARIAVHLLDEGSLPDDFVAERVSRLDRTDGDIDTLMARIAWVRTWTYVAWQREWTRSPEHWQERARAVEDRLSDALHDRLTARFVDRRVAWALRGSEVRAEVEIDGGEVRVGGLPVGTMGVWSYTPGSSLPRGVASAVRARLRTRALERLRHLVEAPHDAITLAEDASLRFEGEALGRLEPGLDLLEPKVATSRLDLLDANERDRVRQRLERWRDELVSGLFAPLDRPAAEGLSPAARGLMYAIRKGLGTVDVDEVRDNLERLTDADRKGLARLDIRFGRRAIYVQSLYRREAQVTRAVLYAVVAHRPVRLPPAEGRAALPFAGEDLELLRLLGYRRAGRLAVRADLLERVTGELRRARGKAGPELVEKLCSWLGVSRDEVAPVVRDLSRPGRAGRSVSAGSSRR